MRPAGRGQTLLLDGWSLLLGLVLVWPLWFHRGMPLGRDMMFVPRQPLTEASVGLGDAAPRAVPLDAVVAVVTSVVDGGVLARVVLPVLLALAGWGVHRLLRDLSLVARFAAAGFAVWNPFVVERLALGQWALLAAYGALPWLGAAAVRYRRDGSGRALSGVVLWGALASLTPTGGLLAIAVVLGLTVDRRRRWVLPVALTVVLQLPWLVPALAGPSGRLSDPDGVAAFASRAEVPGGVLVSLLGLGGIWDSGSVPATRETVFGVAAALFVAVVLVAAFPVARRAWGMETVVRLGVIAAGGTVLALLSTTVPGAELVRFLVVEVPGAGLLRDAQKFIAPLVALASLSVGFAVQRGLDALGTREYRLSLAIAAIAAPLVLLPDAAVTTARTVAPVVYPDGFAEVRERLEQAPAGTALATLPWRAYREFSWGSDVAAADPATRWFDRRVLTSDDLVVGDTTVTGEDPTAAALAEGLRVAPPVEALAKEGVRWVLVYRDDPAAAELDLTGLEEVYADPDLLLLRVPGDVGGPKPTAPGRRMMVLWADGLAALLVACAVAARVPRRSRSKRV